MTSRILQTQTELGTPSAARRATLRPSFVSNCLVILTSQAGMVLMALLLEVCYARLLGPAGRGQLSLSLMAIAAGGLLGGLGGEIPIILWTADQKERTSAFLPAILFWGVLGSLGAVVLWVAVFWFMHPAFLRGITPRLAMFVSVLIPASIAFSYAMAMLSGAERFRERASILIGLKVLTLMGVLIFVFAAGGGAEAALLANLLGMLLALAAVIVLLRRHLLGGWNLFTARAKLGQALSLGIRGQLGNLATFFNYRLDVFLVNYFLNPAQVGLYSLGVIISESLWQLPHAVSLALLPRTARTLKEENAQFTCLVTRQVLALVGLGGVALALLSPWIIPLVFGTKFRASVAVVWWILPGTIALASAKVACAHLAGIGKPEYSSIIASITLLVTATLDVLLIPRMGINGAALASSVAYLLATIMVFSKLKRALAASYKSLLLPSSADFALYRQAWLQRKASRQLENSAGGY